MMVRACAWDMGGKFFPPGFRSGAWIKISHIPAECLEPLVYSGDVHMFFHERALKLNFKLDVFWWNQIPVSHTEPVKTLQVKFNLSVNCYE